MKKLSAAGIVLAVLLFIPAMSSAAQQWSFDPPHGEIAFEVKHILGTVSGYFKSYEGTVAFDPGDVAHSSIDVTIDVKSFDTRVAKRDEHMMSAEFFDVARYPVITFKSDKIIPRGNGKYLAHGKLTMKNVTQDVELPFTFLGEVKSPLVPDTMVAGFKAHLTLDRLQYNVGNGKYYQMGALGKEVFVTISMELTRKIAK